MENIKFEDISTQLDKDLVEIVYDKHIYICSILNINDDIKFKIEQEIAKSDKKIPFVTLIIPVLKEEKMDLIFQKATEMGISKFIVCPMERCMVKLNLNKLDNKLSRWNRICKEASEQSKRNDIPTIEFINNINDLKLLEGQNFTCSTQEKLNNIKKVLKDVKKCDKINLVIGPEGGISIKEEELLNKMGFKSITLGYMIMRVESVPLYLMSVINYEYME